MGDNQKPGGGGKLQPYIPAGNGEKSGEYTDKPATAKSKGVKHCFIKNIKCRCNFKNSRLVGKVLYFFAHRNHDSIPSVGRPNSVVKKIVGGYVVSERYYNSNGEAYLDIDYTCHGNPKTHPEVPHIHRWYKDKNGHLCRNEKWESFEWSENV